MSGHQKQKTKKGGQRKWGRNSIKCALYSARNRREVNKAKRVLQSNGLKYYRKWLKGLPARAQVAVRRAMRKREKVSA